jgi:hypothetical protein
MCSYLLIISHLWGSQLNQTLLRVGSDNHFCKKNLEQGVLNQSFDVEGILDRTKSQWYLNISNALPNDEE